MKIRFILILFILAGCRTLYISKTVPENHKVYNTLVVGKSCKGGIILFLFHGFTFSIENAIKDMYKNAPKNTIGFSNVEISQTEDFLQGPLVANNYFFFGRVYEKYCYILKGFPVLTDKK